MPDDQKKDESQEREGSGDGNAPVGREFFVEMAKQRNARVMLANTLETFVLSDLVRAADAAIKTVRSKLLITIEMEDFAETMGNYNSAILLLSETVSRLFGLYGGNYREPRGIKQIRKNKGVRPGQVKKVFDEVMALMDRRFKELSAGNDAEETKTKGEDNSAEEEKGQKVKAA